MMTGECRLSWSLVLLNLVLMTNSRSAYHLRDPITSNFDREIEILLLSSTVRYLVPETKSIGDSG